MKTHALLAILILGSFVAMNRAFAQDSPSCTNRLIRGTYAFTLEGQKLGGPGPIGAQVGVAMTTFDGEREGGLTQIDSVTVNGTAVSDFTHPPATGNYTVNRDCTGTFNLIFADHRPPVTVDFVVSTNGFEIDTVVTSAGGNQGLIATRSIGKRRFVIFPTRIVW
jgi:hypothetical protein